MTKIESCIVCEIVRPEPFGKLSLLGFFGVCPNVDIALQHLDQPVVLTFVFTGTIDAGTFDLSFAVVDSENERVVATTESKFTAVQGGVALPCTMMFVSGHPSLFFVQCKVNEAEQFRGSFRISQGKQLTL